MGLGGGYSMISVWQCLVKTSAATSSDVYDGLKSPLGYTRLFSSPGDENFQEKVTAAQWNASFYS